jgi:ATP-dependent Clp protease ATP-binding subunit ClpA
MQQQIDDQLANLILAGQISDGSLVTVDYEQSSNKLSVSAEKAS